MNNKIAKVENKPSLTFDTDTVDLIKNTVAVGATDSELKLFLYQAARAGLDPLARQIYFIKRNQSVKQPNGEWKTEGKVSIQTSIDGFRLVAQRGGEYGGQDAPAWFKTNDEKKELYCKVNVYKFHGDQRYLASVGVAYWSEYCPKPGQDFMWQKMPRTMIAKVAEALALRKAFPQELSGLYTNEEMDQANQPEPQPQTAKSVEPEPKTETREALADKFDDEEEIRKADEEVARVESIFKPICVCRTTNNFHRRGCPAGVDQVAQV